PGQTGTVDYVITTPSALCATVSDNAITLTVHTTACPARPFSCVSHVFVPQSLRMQCPADRAVFPNVSLQRRARWTNTSIVGRSFDFHIDVTRDWGALVTGTTFLAPGQAGVAVITLAVPPGCTTEIDDVHFAVGPSGCMGGVVSCSSHVRRP